MTPEQSVQFNEMVRKTNEQHAFWFRSDNAEVPPRSEQFDTMVKHYNQGRFAVRAMFWLGGVTVFVAANLDKVRMFFGGFFR